MSSSAGLPHVLDASSLGLPLVLGAVVALALLLLVPRSTRARITAELRWLAQSVVGPPEGKRARGSSVMRV